MIAGQSYAAGDCKFKAGDGSDGDSSLYTYTGECKNGYADGKGVLILTEEGYRYEGDFKNGNNSDGKGVLINSDGDRLEGEWKNHILIRGNKQSFNDGNRYEYLVKNGEEWGFHGADKKGDAFYINGERVKYCLKAECDPDYPDLDTKTKTDIMISKITTAIKAERYKDALPYFVSLERKNSNLPESFYFHYIQSLSKAGYSEATNIQAQEYLKKYGSKGKYYTEVVEIMGR